MTEAFTPAGKEFEEFYERHYKAVYRLCYTYMKNSFDAEDCTEDTFVRVLSGSYSFENEQHEHSWLMVTAGNVCKDRLKHWWRRKVEPVEEYEETLSEPEREPDETLEAVLELPTKYKEVVYLHYYEGYQTEKIAAMLKRPASTVRNQLRDARIKLKQRLGGDFL
ncbi:MAG: RNA polymerase sigma factor [Lachnospiraceae bacterium]